MVPFVCAVIEMRLSITNGNHEGIYNRKQSFSINDCVTILSLLVHFDFDLVSSHVTWEHFLYS